MELVNGHSLSRNDYIYEIIRKNKRLSDTQKDGRIKNMKLKIHAKKRLVCLTEVPLLKIYGCIMAESRRVELKGECSVSFEPRKSRPPGKKILVGPGKVRNPFFTLGIIE